MSERGRKASRGWHEHSTSSQVVVDLTKNDDFSMALRSGSGSLEYSPGTKDYQAPTRKKTKTMHHYTSNLTQPPLQYKFDPFAEDPTSSCKPPAGDLAWFGPPPPPTPGFDTESFRSAAYKRQKSHDNEGQRRQHTTATATATAPAPAIAIAKHQAARRRYDWLLAPRPPTSHPPSPEKGRVSRGLELDKDTQVDNGGVEDEDVVTRTLSRTLGTLRTLDLALDAPKPCGDYRSDSVRRKMLRDTVRATKVPPSKPSRVSSCSKSKDLPRQGWSDSDDSDSDDDDGDEESMGERDTSWEGFNQMDLRMMRESFIACELAELRKRHPFAPTMPTRFNPLRRNGAPPRTWEELDNPYAFLKEWRVQRRLGRINTRSRYACATIGSSKHCSDCRRGDSLLKFLLSRKMGSYAWRVHCNSPPGLCPLCNPFSAYRRLQGPQTCLLASQGSQDQVAVEPFEPVDIFTVDITQAEVNSKLSEERVEVFDLEGLYDDIPGYSLDDTPPEGVLTLDRELELKSEFSFDYRSDSSSEECPETPVMKDLDELSDLSSSDEEDEEDERMWECDLSTAGEDGMDTDDEEYMRAKAGAVEGSLHELEGLMTFRT